MARKRIFKPKTTPTGMKIISIFIALVLILLVPTQFGLYDLGKWIPWLITFFVALFLMVEAGYKKYLVGSAYKKLTLRDGLNLFTFLVAGSLLTIAIFSVPGLGLTVPVLLSAKAGIISALGFLLALIHIFV